MVNCILLVLLLLVSMILLKCTNSPLVIHFLNFVRLLHLQVLLIIILPVSFVIFLMIVPNDYPCKDTFSFVLQIKNVNLSKRFLVSYDVTSLFTIETIDIAINLIWYHNTNLRISRKELENVFFLLHRRFILFLTVSFIIKLIEQPWVLFWLVSLPTSSQVFMNLSGLLNIILTNLNFI